MFYQLDLYVFKKAPNAVFPFIGGDREKKLSGSSETKYCPTLPPLSPTEIKYKTEGGMKQTDGRHEHFSVHLR